MGMSNRGRLPAAHEGRIITQRCKDVKSSPSCAGVGTLALTDLSFACRRETYYPLRRTSNTEQAPRGEEVGDMFARITFDPAVMGGRACLRGMRIPVSLVINLVANGMSVEEILHEYPTLEAEDIREALRYAASLAGEEVYPLPTGAHP